MNLFHVIDDGVAILRTRGRYKQAKLFHRGDYVYAELARGIYIRLLSNGATSVPDVSYIEVEGPGVVSHNGVPSVSQVAVRAAA